MGLLLAFHLIQQVSYIMIPNQLYLGRELIRHIVMTELEIYFALMEESPNVHSSIVTSDT